QRDETDPVHGRRLPSTVTGQVPRFTFLMRRRDAAVDNSSRSLRAERVVQAELEDAVHGLRLGHALQRGRADLFQPPAQRQVVAQPDVALRGPAAVAVETLQVVRLQIETPADALAHAPLEAVR